MRRLHHLHTLMRCKHPNRISLSAFSLVLTVKSHMLLKYHGMHLTSLSQSVSYLSSFYPLSVRDFHTNSSSCQVQPNPEIIAKAFGVPEETFKKALRLLVSSQDEKLMAQIIQQPISNLRRSASFVPMMVQYYFCKMMPGDNRRSGDVREQQQADEWIQTGAQQ